MWKHNAFKLVWKANSFSFRLPTIIEHDSHKRDLGSALVKQVKAVAKQTRRNLSCSRMLGIWRPTPTLPASWHALFNNIYPAEFIQSAFFTSLLSLIIHLLHVINIEFPFLFQSWGTWNFACLYALICLNDGRNLVLLSIQLSELMIVILRYGLAHCSYLVELVWNIPVFEKERFWRRTEN